MITFPLSPAQTTKDARTPRAVLTQEEAVEIYIFGPAIRRRGDEFNLQNDGSVELAKKYNVSPKTIRDVWNRQTWAKVTEHLWEKNARPMGKSTRSLTSQKAYSDAGIQSGDHKSDSASKPQGHSPQQTCVYTPDLQASFPSFAEVASHGVRCIHANSPPRRPPSSSPGYAQHLVAASAAPSHPPPPTAAILPPPIAPWALGPADCFRDSAGACGICGAPCGGAAAGDCAAAAFDDPFRSDWPHW
jgi:hypothetical protein